MHIPIHYGDVVLDDCMRSTSFLLGMTEGTIKRKARGNRPFRRGFSPLLLQQSGFQDGDEEPPTCLAVHERRKSTIVNAVDKYN